MFRLVYSILFALCMPFVYLKLLWRGHKAPEYQARKLQRFGWFKAPPLRHCIWIHAVSVGEVLAAEPIIRQLQARYPQRDIAVTTMTPTSSELLLKLFGDSVFHVYAPYDLPFMVSAFLHRIKPEFLIIMETELWPNMIHQASKMGCPVVIANARLSERSAAGYRRLNPVIGWMLNELSLVLCQYQNDATRFSSIGITADKIKVTGSVKYDVRIDPANAEKGRNLRSLLVNQQTVWIAASTHSGEDERILAVQQQLRARFPDVVLVLVPRHPERFDQVCRLAQHTGFKTYRRTACAQIPADTDVFVVDTMGELLAFYAAADVAFVGGSLVEVGGHNPIEPGALALPILMGPNTFNFEAICGRLAEVGALHVVADETELVAQLTLLLANPSLAQERGRKALAEVEASKGAVQRVVEHLAPLLDAQNA